ncbi:AraC family transcriptional regulator [Neorhizobium sp. NCHU2750]|uniref:AraC family transcriptional regulator n=1 Tax=Neorhizobium sp. NCHU2750 TaxID=1825976 RepID=UPI000E723B27|nr:AraC family transcriptional regulator [Neorhizobium sp. NCHU2750]
MMDELIAEIRRYTDRKPGENIYFTPINTVAILRSDYPKPPAHRMSQPSMCIVVQGAKWANFGGNRFEYKAGEALVIGVEAPSVGRVVEASPDHPCLVLMFELDLAIMRSVAAELADPPKPRSEPCRGVFVTNFQGPIADCALRLVRLFDMPNAIPTLYPVIMREICYWLLTGPHGADIARMALVNNQPQRVLEAVRVLRERFAEPIRVDELAAVAQLSPSAFHRHFKALTLLSPLQYQKQLRLLEARRLLASQGLNVEAAAFQVGYESPSQFSREYSRMFGEAPKRDARRVGSQLGDEDSGDAAAAVMLQGAA